MRTLLVLLLLAVGATAAARAQSVNPQYDSTLAARLGANDFGLKKYFFVLLRTGPAPAPEKRVSDSLFAGHFANMGRMVAAHKLVVAGPIVRDDRQVRGIFIIDAADRAQLDSLLAGDPAIAAKLLTPDVYEWYGSAALPEYLPASDKVWKRSP